MQPPVPELPSSFTLDDLALLLAVALVAIVAYLVAGSLLSTVGARLVGRANPRLRAALEQQQFFGTVALLAPALVVGFAAPLLRPRFSWAYDLLTQLLSSYVIVAFALTLYKLLGAFEALLTEDKESSIVAALKGLFRWLRVGLLVTAVLLAIGVFANVPVTSVLTGIGVIIAAGSIVFGDMIYNTVAQLILKARHLVAVGDWLEVPALQINGEVKEIGPLLIKVQNWDNTLATVPPRYLLTNTFRNWQQMFRVGRRRILRYIYVDVTTVRPLDEELLAVVRDLPAVAAELDRRIESAGSARAAMLTLTNTALYRAYLMDYLATHPKVAHDALFRVTNEDAVGQGLPLLLLAFLTETQDLPFRLTDAEIYEHALAVAPRFGLRVFQAPAGSDLRDRRDIAV